MKPVINVHRNDLEAVLLAANMVVASEFPNGLGAMYVHADRKSEIELQHAMVLTLMWSTDNMVINARLDLGGRLSPSHGPDAYPVIMRVEPFLLLNWKPAETQTILQLGERLRDLRQDTYEAVQRILKDGAV